MNKLKSLLYSIARPDISYPVSAMFLVFCLIFPFWLHPVQSTVTDFHSFLVVAYYNSIVFTVAISFVYLFLCITYLIGKWNRTFSKLFLVVIWTVSLSVSIPSSFLRKCFNIPFNAMHIQLLHETNISESSEFISTYVFSIDTLVLFLIYLISVVVIVLLCNWMRKLQISNNIYRLSVSLVSIICVVSLGYVGTNIKCFCSERNYAGAIGFSPIYEYLYAFRLHQVQGQEFDRCIECQKTNSVDSCSYTSSNIVLVIGESYNRHHSSLYGYELLTNPKIENRKGIYVFSDVISNVAVTHQAFQLFLSCASTDSKMKWCDAPLFPKVFRDAGYYVTLFSNQFISDVSQDEYDADASFINMKGINAACFDLRNTNKYQFDGDLVKEYQKQAIKQKQNKLTIFHLIGQHVKPERRYRKENAVFDVSDIKRDNMSETDKQAIANYDNATLYNDSVVDAIMGMYENDDAIVIYFADHGDEANDFRLHVGRSSEYDKYGAKLMHCLLDIPFIVYCTPKYIEGHPDIVKRIEASVDNPFMTDDLPHLLFDLAGIHTKWFDPKRSVLNEEFNKKRKRLVSNQDTGQQYDYDKFCKKTDGWPNTQCKRNINK